jgi:hypothetical protein
MTDKKDPRMALSEEAAKLLEYCPPEQVERFGRLAERVVSGPRPRSAAIRLACIQCTNWDLTEVRKCQITKCALHGFRSGA